MKNYFPGYRKYGLGLFVFILTFSICYWAGGNWGLLGRVAEAKISKETARFDERNPNLQAALAAQRRHTPVLMAIPEVIGTAIALSEAGKPAILVLTEEAVEAGVIPRNLEGMPVIVKVTGKIFALKKPPGTSVDLRARFMRPVPIGVSTGNEGECSAGTIGARLKKGSSVYALSNNHVYALENAASKGSRVLQPGLYDTNCSIDENDVIGTLADYEPIEFSASAVNIIDAAIALSATGLLDNATPVGGYGTPKSSPVAPAINQSVQKYGRTTALTKGTIIALNATINVGYSTGTAMFVNQIVVSGRSFIKPGDSGSLLVTYPRANPVGLLFAGNASGRYAFANPIQDVLRRFGAAIDGQ
jgi:hypothetical protein